MLSYHSHVPGGGLDNPNTHNLVIHRIPSGPGCLHCDLPTHTGSQDLQTSTPAIISGGAHTLEGWSLDARPSRIQVRD